MHSMAEKAGRLWLSDLLHRLSIEVPEDTNVMCMCPLRPCPLPFVQVLSVPSRTPVE